MPVLTATLFDTITDITYDRSQPTYTRLCEHDFLLIIAILHIGLQQSMLYCGTVGLFKFSYTCLWVFLFNGSIWKQFDIY